VVETQFTNMPNKTQTDTHHLIHSLLSAIFPPFYILIHLFSHHEFTSSPTNFLAIAHAIMHYDFFNLNCDLEEKLY